MILRLTALSALTVAAVAVVMADSGTRLEIAASPAIAQIQPKTEGRKLVRLPNLDYELLFKANCEDSAAMPSVSISINDTRLTLDSDQLAENYGAPISLTVPAQQVAPVAVDQFCTGDDTATQQGELLIRDAVTAHMSLRCSSDETESISYASQGLDVTLLCEVPDTDQSIDETDR